MNQETEVVVLNELLRLLAEGRNANAGARDVLPLGNHRSHRPRRYSPTWNRQLCLERMAI